MRSFLSATVWAFLGLCVAPAGAFAASPITLDQVLGAPISSAPVASPTGGKFAWTVNQRGRRNIWVAEPGSGGYVARQVTAYSEDDGLELGELAWTRDAKTLLFTRGGTLRGGFLNIDRVPNVASAPAGPAAQEVLALSLDTTSVRRIGEGRGAVVSPRGDLVAYLAGGQIWAADLSGKAAPRRLIVDMGSPGGQVPGVPPSMAWSPDGSKLAFVTQRGDHSFVGAYDLAGQTITWLAPSADTDSQPVWSPDSRRVAFVRMSGGGFPQPRAGWPWAIIVADAATGQGGVAWQADPGIGSVFTTSDASNVRPLVLWGDDDQLVFTWEKTGWAQLYAVSATGGPPRALTSGTFEVVNAELSPDRRTVIYASNQDDPDRRHVWKVPVVGGAPTRLDRGHDVVDFPTMSSDGSRVAALHSGGVSPLQPVILLGDGAAKPLMDPALLRDYPAARLRSPEAVTFKSVDGLDLHGQLFLPPADVTRRPPGPGLLFFHGGPRKQALLGWSNEPQSYANNLYLAAQGYTVLSVNYRGGSGYGLEFRTPDKFGPLGGSEAQDARAGALYLAARGDIDRTRIGSWGHSYGGMMTAQGLGRSSDLIAVGVNYAGLTNWRSLFLKAGFLSPADTAAGAAMQAASPVGAIDAWKSPVLLIYADDDRATPLSQMIELTAGLRRRGVAFEQKVVPNETHNPQLYRSILDIYGATNAFLGKHLAQPRP